MDCKDPLIAHLFKGVPEKNPSIPASWLVNKSHKEITALMGALTQRYNNQRGRIKMASRRNRKKIRNPTVGVKSAVEYTRSDAEARFVDFYKQCKSQQRNKITNTRMDKFPSLSMTIRLAYQHVDIELHSESWNRDAQQELTDMSDEVLGRKLTKMNDEINDGEGYDSFYIVDNPSNFR